MAAYIDVTDATFEQEVMARSMQVPVVVDLWAEWCGPCRTLGPILETVIAETGGRAVLAKVDVDANPAISQAFRVQSIPAVYLVKDGAIADGFMGAQPEAAVRDFVARHLPAEEQTETELLVAAGDEASLRRALELEPGSEAVVVPLAELLVGDGRDDEALELLARIPESPGTRRIAALARLGGAAADGVGDDVESQLAGLLGQVKGDDEARQRFVDLLEVLGADDPRTAVWRRRLTSALY